MNVQLNAPLVDVVAVHAIPDFHPTLTEEFAAKPVPLNVTFAPTIADEEETVRCGVSLNEVVALWDAASVPVNVYFPPTV